MRDQNHDATAAFLLLNCRTLEVVASYARLVDCYKAWVRRGILTHNLLRWNEFHQKWEQYEAHEEHLLSSRLSLDEFLSVGKEMAKKVRAAGADCCPIPWIGYLCRSALGAANT